MPRIELRDAAGISYRIDSFDWDQVRAWLDMWTAELSGGNPPPAGCALTMSIWPLARFNWETGIFAEPDWSADTRHLRWFVVPWDTEGIMAAIEAERKRTEEEKTSGR